MCKVCAKEIEVKTCNQTDLDNSKTPNWILIKFNARIKIYSAITNNGPQYNFVNKYCHRNDTFLVVRAINIHKWI